MDRRKVKEIAGDASEVAERTVGGILRLAIRIVVAALLIFLIAGLLFALIFACYVKTELSPELKVTLEDASVSLSSTIWYTDSNGEDKELITLSSGEDRIWVSYDQLPEGMEHALVAIEDKRFYEHKGVDWYRTSGAFVQMFLSMSNDFGGSTLTQQLIKNVTDNDADLVSRKLMEIFQALELEKTYTKQEIVEWYLNIVYFGEGSYGVYTAAQKYFGKDVWDLSLAECASIIGITNNPSKYDPFIANTIRDKDLDLTLSCREWNKYRQELILYEMYDQGYITHDEYIQAKNEELHFVRAENESAEMEIRSYYVETVIDDVLADLREAYGINQERAKEMLYYGGLQVYCCLDKDIQSIVDSVYEDVENLPQPYYAAKQQLQSAIVIMDPYTGKIVALQGATGKKTVNDPLNRATEAYRPCGSSIKPLSAYGPALEYGLITQNTLVKDAPGMRLSGTNWFPANSPNSYSGIISIRTALALSKNTVAAQIVDKLTPRESYKFLTERLGFTSLVEDDANYAPLALGQFTYGVTVREMAQAYCSFVNSGTFTYGRTYTKVLNSEGEVVLSNEPKTIQAFSERTAANICNMLQNAVASGTGTSANFSGMAVAGKTGTTSDNKDRYFCGFTPYYVAACWTGYDTPEVMYFYGNPAATIWKTVMQQIHAELPQESFPTPVVGYPTNIFGDLAEEYEEQEYKRTHPDEEEEPEESPEPEETESPEPSESPVVTPAPAETTAPENPGTPAESVVPSESDVPETETPETGDPPGEDPGEPEPVTPVEPEQNEP